MSETAVNRVGAPRGSGENQFPEASKPAICHCSVRSVVTRFLPLPTPGQFSVYPSSLPSLFSGCPATVVPSQCPRPPFKQCSGEPGYPAPARTPFGECHTMKEK